MHSETPTTIKYWVMRMKTMIKRLRKEEGGSLLEAAFMIPLLVLFLIGVVDLGRAYHTYVTIINAAREGARYGVSHADIDDIKAHVRAEAELSQVDIPLSGITVDHGGPGNPVRVTVVVEFSTLIGNIVGIPNFPIKAYAAFMVR
ncbi:MAG: pilus assembly protein [Anaerolineae bacterium]|nr:pilus assembly protein [Anaerolineae bacterium]